MHASSRRLPETGQGAPELQENQQKGRPNLRDVISSLNLALANLNLADRARTEAQTSVATAGRALILLLASTGDSATGKGAYETPVDPPVDPPVETRCPETGLLILEKTQAIVHNLMSDLAQAIRYFHGVKQVRAVQVLTCSLSHAIMNLEKLETTRLEAEAAMRGRGASLVEEAVARTLNSVHQETEVQQETSIEPQRETRGEQTREVMSRQIQDVQPFGQLNLGMVHMAIREFTQARVERDEVYRSLVQNIGACFNGVSSVSAEDLRGIYMQKRMRCEELRARGRSLLVALDGLFD